MINYYINSKRIYIDENDYSIIFINKPCLDKGNDDERKGNDDERKGNDDERKGSNDERKGSNNHKGNINELKGSNKDLIYTLDDSYYNFSINPSQLEESMIIFK